jgi:hypothetical protein
MSYRSYRSDSVILLSFAYTSPAYDARVKTCTRRNWVAQYAARFRPGVQFMGYDRSPRYRGVPLHASRVISCQLEPIIEMPDDDFEHEGFGFIARSGDWQAVKNLAVGVCGPELQGFGRHQKRRFYDACRMSPEFVLHDAFNKWRASSVSLWTLRFEHLP